MKNSRWYEFSTNNQWLCVRMIGRNVNLMVAFNQNHYSVLVVLSNSLTFSCFYCFSRIDLAPIAVIYTWWWWVRVRFGTDDDLLFLIYIIYMVFGVHLFFSGRSRELALPPFDPSHVSVNWGHWEMCQCLVSNNSAEYSVFSFRILFHVKNEISMLLRIPYALPRKIIIRLP